MAFACEIGVRAARNSQASDSSYGSQAGWRHVVRLACCCSESRHCARRADIKNYAVRPEGAFHQWRKVPPRELSIVLVADERFGWATGWIEAS
jgi:hypothetical protein